jgi:hypothetical protein
MRFLKLGIISVVFFALLLTAISLLLPSTIHISRAIDINAPAEVVYANVNNFANWKKWYADYDSSASVLSANTTGASAGLTIKKTSIKILESSPKQVKAIWQSENNNPLPGEFNFISQDSSSNMTIQWRFTQTVKWYPWQKFASIISDKAIGPAMEKSLENLKNVSESQ